MVMDIEETVKRLSSLVQHDIDAVHAYEQAIQQIDVATIRELLNIFRKDHDRHIRELTGKIRELGGFSGTMMQCRPICKRE